MSNKIIDNNESSVRSYSIAFPVVFKKAHGSIIYSQHNKEYIDFFSGAGALNYGHNHEVLNQRLIEYIKSDGIMHSLDMMTEAKITFISTFVSKIIKPRKLNYHIQFTGPTGANAVEAALKLARLNTKRSNIVAFTHAFHGVSLGALSATSNRWFREAAGVELNNVTFLPFENYVDNFDSIDYLDKALLDPASGIDIPAAVIVETIQGEGGVNITSPLWLKRLREITTKHNILLIVDDIQAGCGRSGQFFSFEEANIEPDLVILSKSISGSGLPMSLLLIKPKYDIWKPGQHNGTFRGNNLAFVTATAAINEFWTTQKFQKAIEQKQSIIYEKLAEIANEYLSEDLIIRGRGMFFGLDFRAHPNNAKKIAKKCLDNGLIIEVAGSHNEVLKLLPALNIPVDLLIKGLDIIKKSIAESA